jgi:hypothetical protein
MVVVERSWARQSAAARAPSSAPPRRLVNAGLATDGATRYVTATDDLSRSVAERSVELGPEHHRILPLFSFAHSAIDAAAISTV